ncbi:MAG: DUF523 domain-containing protein [Syntrophales bacterium]|jgi:uncharacterized protein YbbK (DUF523 family)|nr:DUF523 domain-containing protein [Syntrophales bacterium]MDY0044167.1 DUF523 domain-containing protein [Syntrophales bacterium]
MIIVSSCLLGVCCRYDATHSIDRTILSLADLEAIIPVCPEQLGGLTTPRPPAQIVKGSGIDVLMRKAKVIDSENRDVTSNFLTGAEMALLIAQTLKIKKAILKERSPSCGVHYIKKGDLLTKGSGVTTELFRRNGIRVISSAEINKEFLMS